ncbi:MAG: sterol desaturase family protein, partial [Pseudomonadales bacterium]|nr:sterol desaturase family protein [Pseudomonadales bacterium]
TKSDDQEKQNGEYEYKPRQVSPQQEQSFKFGDGKISGFLSCFLGVLSFLAVLCYLFPSYLTTTEFRAAYDADFLQGVLKYGMLFSMGFALITFFLGKRRKLGAIGALFTVGAFALGGYTIETGPVEPSNLSFGLDWLIIAFLVSAILFIFLEKVFPKYSEQVILRPEWRLDIFYFCINHLLITVLLLVGNYFAVTVFGWAVSRDFQIWIQSLPIGVQVVILIFSADFVLYWSHRMFHESPILWKFHAVHHSVEHMDWMAGSRNHVVQTFVDRCLVLVPLYLLGADKLALDIYVSFAAFQAVYVHANVGIPLGPLKYIITTPQYHHWHHSSQKPAIDTNYAVHMPFYDILFKTYHMPGDHWPSDYGTTKKLPRTYFGQFMYPFRRG